MEKNGIKFDITGKTVIVRGYPELEGKEGSMAGNGMALFFGIGAHNHELFIANTQTGKIRKLSTLGGTLLVDDDEIDYEAIAKKCKKGLRNAQNKDIRYAKIGNYGRFENGVCAISWMLYPEGGYFADSDGFGGGSNYEEEVYAIIDTELNIIEPFRPVYNIDEYLKEVRKNRKEILTDKNSTDMKKRIFNLIILDESGSMDSIKQEAINSVNETIQTISKAQRTHENQEHIVSLVTFNDDVKKVYECVQVDKVKELTDETYNPSCCTALYDALGISLTSLSKKVAEDDNVLVTVVTDGYENSSREYNAKSIKNLIDKFKDKGWIFAYIGANHNVEEAAATISITNIMKFEATSTGTKTMVEHLNRSRERLYNNIETPDFSAKEANNNFFDEEEV